MFFSRVYNKPKKYVDELRFKVCLFLLKILFKKYSLTHLNCKTRNNLQCKNIIVCFKEIEIKNLNLVDTEIIFLQNASINNVSITNVPEMILKQNLPLKFTLPEILPSRFFSDINNSELDYYCDSNDMSLNLKNTDQLFVLLMLCDKHNIKVKKENQEPND